MHQVKLILTDIDGTILPTGQHEVSSRTVEAIHAALDAGLVVGPASGRGKAQIPPFFGGDRACCDTCIATNGLEVYLHNEKICEKLLPRTSLEQLMAYLQELPGAGLICFEGAQPLLCAGQREDLDAVFSAYARACLPCDGLPDFPVLKANVFMNTDAAGTVGLVADLNERIEGLDFDMPMVGYTNIMPSGWNKGAAVRCLCEHMGIGLDEVVVFGDAGNDLAMFDVVPNSVAVAGATPEAAAAARWHIGRCEDDAVADAMFALAAGSWPF
ncbi:HAD family hydrolase [Collinsella sp. An2]|uniref:HAD family hydrolase n=1 Tax=Collinsella sp. An2 TaxID=1965585 RepID=UPI000B367DAC|nr:HAD family hydrolase [Collinsella sp. An2]OUP09479.1 haloacid dehalogenase [Collinsella sp. An2]